MIRPAFQSRKGSILLVALCFVTVLGISLASYLAVCSRTMQISNRTAQTALSRQLAEMGLEEGLRAFNKNDWAGWTSGGVTVTWDTTTYASSKRAVATIAFPASQFGQGVTGSVKIRIDNYDGDQLGAAWSSTANYKIGNLVGYTDGNWYRAIADSLGKTPSTTTSTNMYWLQEQGLVSASMNWQTGTSYVVGNLVIANKAWYRCSSAHTASSTSQPPSGASWTSYWVAVPYLSADADLHYTNEAVLNYYQSWYRYLTATGWDGPLPSGSWSTTWRWAASTSYVVGNVVNTGNVWYRCKTANSDASFTASKWDTAATTATTAAAAWNWNSSLTYNLNDVVYSGSRWYRSLAMNNTNNTPSTSSAYWSTSPLLSRSWDAGSQYSQNDTVFYNGVWYLSLQNTNVNQNPSTQTSYWRSTAVAAYQWNATTTYSSGVYRSYGGVWYHSLSSSNTGKSPNNTTYWTPASTQSSGATMGATVIYAEGTINLAGSAATKTQLRTVVAPTPLFPNAVGASTNVTINGGGTVDSYDSSLGTYASQTPGYSAVLAAKGTTTPALTVTSTTVNGYAAAPSSSTSPYAPMWSFGGSAVLKGTSSGTGIDLTRVSRSPYVPQFDCLPGSSLSAAFAAGTFSSGTNIPAPGAADLTLNLGTPGAITPTIYNYNGNLRLQSGSTSYYRTINVNGPVILYVNGYLRASPGGSLIIADTGSAEIHFTNYLRSLATCGGFINRTKDPKKLTLIGDGNTSSVCYLFPFTDPAGLDSSFYGTIYLPNITGTGGLTVYTGVVIYGAISAQNVTFDAEATVHYDVSLRYATMSGVDQPYSITEWRELTDVVEAATMP